MGKLYIDLIRMLLAADCVKIREGRGSHEIWRSPRTGRTFAVPTNLDNRHLANAILKQAGLPKDFL